MMNTEKVKDNILYSRMEAEVTTVGREGRRKNIRGTQIILNDEIIGSTDGVWNELNEAFTIEFLAGEEIDSKIRNNLAEYCSRNKMRISYVTTGCIPWRTENFVVTCLLDIENTEKILLEGYRQAYCYNVDHPEKSEFRDIYIVIEDDLYYAAGSHLDMEE